MFDSAYFFTCSCGKRASDCWPIYLVAGEHKCGDCARNQAPQGVYECLTGTLDLRVDPVPDPE